MYDYLALSDNGFLFDTRRGGTYTLNRTGTFVLRQLMAGTSAEAAADQLTAQFEVELPLARRDVEQFVFRLQDLGVIPRGDEGEPSGGSA